MTASDKQEPEDILDETLQGHCPVCGEKVIWTPTARLWPSRRMKESAFPSHSGTCPRCHCALMFTVVSDSPED